MGNSRLTLHSALNGAEGCPQQALGAHPPSPLGVRLIGEGLVHAKRGELLSETMKVGGCYDCLVQLALSI